MRARVLVDNTPAGELQGEWGLSIYIEQGDKKILLDTGASGLFLENAKEFGIDLSEVDLAVLSHAHSDHANGMPAFFAINKKAKFYLQAKAGENCYSKGRFLYKYEGLPKGMLKQYRDRIAFVSDNYKLCEGVWLIPHKTAGLETIGKREKLYVRRGLRWFPDDFAHEQSLVLETEQGLAIFNSCSHGGAYTIIEEVRAAFPGKPVCAMVGGFHLYTRSEAEVRQFAGRLKEMQVGYICTGHCTGDKAYDILREELGESLHHLHVGLTIEI